MFDTVARVSRYQYVRAAILRLTSDRTREKEKKKRKKKTTTLISPFRSYTFNMYREKNTRKLQPMRYLTRVYLCPFCSFFFCWRDNNHQNIVSVYVQHFRYFYNAREKETKRHLRTIHIYLPLAVARWPISHVLPSFVVYFAPTRCFLSHSRTHDNCTAALRSRFESKQR